MQDENNQSASEPKKVSLAEAIRNKLAQKKQDQQNEKNNNGLRGQNEKAKSQITKKPNNQRRRTGGS
jgi:hypothetical protein